MCEVGAATEDSCAACKPGEHGVAGAVGAELLTLLLSTEIAIRHGVERDNERKLSRFQQTASVRLSH